MFEFGRKSIRSGVTLQWFHLHCQNLILIKSHVIVHHIAVLQVDKQGYNDQYGRDDKLGPDQNIAQQDSGTGGLKVSFRGQSWREGGNIVSRVDADDDSEDQRRDNQQQGYIEIVRRKYGRGEVAGQ